MRLPTIDLEMTVQRKPLLTLARIGSAPLTEIVTFALRGEVNGPTYASLSSV